MPAPYPPLRNLAVIGNRRTAAVVGTDATIWWYCPRRFDGPSLLAGLLDPGKGLWRVYCRDAVPRGRAYLGDSAVLETRLSRGGEEMTVTDWMTQDEAGVPARLCRRFSPAPDDVVVSLDPWTEDGRRRAALAGGDGHVTIDARLHLFTSHPLSIDDRGVHWVLPKGEAGWTVLAEGPIAPPTQSDLERWQAATVGRWNELASHTAYDGPFRDQVAASLRALRLLVFEETGAVVAAITAGLPEVIGGQRNYDYRYAWLRDSAMMVRALVHTEHGGPSEREYLRFVAASREHARHPPLDPVIALDRHPVADEQNPPLAGYRNSHPVRIGNRAGKQMQLGAFGNFLLAAAMIYREHEMRDHWGVVASVADFLATHWQEPDSGIWESPTRRQYTASKAFAASGLEAVAEFAPPERATRYRAAAKAIRNFVMSRCRTREGAFAAFEGSDGVDISAALFPIWSFVAADAPEMLSTIDVLLRDYARGGLFQRQDETPEAEREGAFLPGTFWMAQYWVARGDLVRARSLIEAGLAHVNDVGLFPEEIDAASGEMLGNLPLGMTHASFLNAVADLAKAQQSG